MSSYQNQGLASDIGHGPIGDDPKDSLFSEQQAQSESHKKPWWSAHLNFGEPVLFGTWDGVFTSVMVNIFGVIIFLRMGWIVGEAGIAHATVLLFCCAALAIAPVLSAVGICERCQIQSGGVYFLISHVLGATVGGAVGIVFTLGQCVGLSLVAVGFAEGIEHLFKTENEYLKTAIAIITILVLLGVNLAGVTYVVRLQIFLLGILLLAVADFVVGSLFRREPASGVVGMNSTNFALNIRPDFTKGQSLFSVFGVFFSNYIGVLAGVNMAGDLKNPKESIPIGELAAVATSTGICFIFVMLLGATCMREFLINDLMIALTVSATRLLFLAGLYISSLSSILGSMCGPPRVLQGIAAEGLIPAINSLSAGVGANKTPVKALCVMTAISILFVLVGDLNRLAIMSTIPFMITYAAVNYAYVCLAMTYDIQQDRKERLAAGLPVSSYGSMANIKTPSHEPSDLDHLFPERRAGNMDLEGDPEKSDPAADAPDLGGEGDTTLLTKQEVPRIVDQPETWYSLFCNRWFSLTAAIINFLIIIPMDPLYSSGTVALVILLYVYIGRANPLAFAGISEFSAKRMIIKGTKGWMIKAMTKFGICPDKINDFAKEKDSEHMVIPGTSTAGTNIKQEVVTEENVDYQDRQGYHQAQKFEKTLN